MPSIADRADAVVVNVDDPDERDIVEKFQLRRAPMPLALAVAPSGAIMGGFPTEFSEQDLVNAFGTPCTEQVMKTVQDSKLVLLCVQNGKTKSNDEALQGVRDFEADSRYSGSTKVVMLDPADSAEASFLKDLKIDPKTEQAVTVLIAPPGVAVTEVEGPVTKDVLADALQKASSAAPVDRAARAAVDRRVKFGLGLSPTSQSPSRERLARSPRRYSGAGAEWRMALSHSASLHSAEPCDGQSLREWSVSRSLGNQHTPNHTDVFTLFFMRGLHS